MLNKRSITRAALISISLPTLASTWSGWVGLGGLSGFGIVQPFPGISDFELDTRITLPLGSEAFMTLAMYYATSSETNPRARRFASWSAAFAFVASMTANAGYHYMVNSGITHPHWLVTVAVSSVPIMCLAASMLLYHLTGMDSVDVVVGEDVQEAGTRSLDVQEAGDESKTVVVFRPSKKRVVLDGVVERPGLSDQETLDILSRWISKDLTSSEALDALGVPRSTAYAMRKRVQDEGAI